METLRFLTSNYLIDVAFAAWLSAQVLKTLLYYLDTNTFRAERLVGSGGMPSAHSALVCSIAVGMSRKMGFASPEFALALTLAGIVMYDAMGVRRAAGEQAKVLNKMIFSFKLFGEDFWKDFNLDQELTDSDLEEPEPKELKEFLGHTPLEVLGGALLGILVAVLIPVF